MTRRGPPRSIILRQDDTHRLKGKAGEVFQRADLLWIGSRGRRETPPNSLFRTFPDAGIAAFRSHYGPDANFLVLRAGPPGAAHMHEDVLAVDGDKVTLRVHFASRAGTLDGTAMTRSCMSDYMHLDPFEDDAALPGCVAN